MPIESIDLKSGTPVIFRHPNIARKLHIGTGVSGISWSYNLNTFPQSTYGGEVVQVLSAFVGPITVHGQTSDNRQLRQIADWFLEYMQLAGLHNRDEHFITMEYPERGWSFWIQVNQLPNFHYNRDEIAVEWEINAEITADNDLNYLSQMTMSAYTETAFDPSMWDIKFMEHDKRNDPIQLDPSLGLKIGDNFQALLGAWATGDFAHLAFDSTASLKANHLKNAREYWTELYGSPNPFSTTSGTSGGSSAIGSVAGNSPTAIVANAFIAQGLPPELGVAVAMQESGLDPNKYQYPVGPPPYSGHPVKGSTGVGLFQTTNVGGNEQALANKAIDHFPDHITQWFSAAQQASSAAARFKPYRTGDLAVWAYDAQRPADRAGYIAAINRNLPIARQKIQAAGVQKIGAGGSPKARAAVGFALSQLGTPYSQAQRETPGVGFDCSGLCQWAYRQAGVSIPPTTYTQFPALHVVNGQGNMVPGDMIFCYPGEGGNPGPGHVVMYIGNGKVVAAPHTGTVVQIENASIFLASGVFVGIRRPAP